LLFYVCHYPACPPYQVRGRLLIQSSVCLDSSIKSGNNSCFT
jgi:hypothetical protein